MKGFSYLIAALACLILGAFTYLVYSPSAFFLQSVFGNTLINSWHNKIILIKEHLPFPQFIRNHMADMLWYQALLFVTFYVYHIKKLFHTSSVYYFTLSLPFIAEFLQLARVIPGTFDWKDMISYLILLVLNYSVYIRKKKTNET